MIRLPDETAAANAALEILLRLGITALPVRPGTVLRAWPGVRLMTYAQAAESIGITEDALLRRCGDAEAFVAEDEGGTLLCYRADGNPARRNFTLAHEWGHIVLAHTEGGAAEEAEANAFASQLLMPQPVVRRLKAEGGGAAKLARLCYVTLPAAEMALRRTLHADGELCAQVEKQLLPWLNRSMPDINATFLSLKSENTQKNLKNFKKGIDKSEGEW